MAALLFDLDGTMLVSDPIHEAVFRELFAEYGLSLTDDFYAKGIHGRHNADIFAEFLPDVPDHPGLGARKEAMFRARLPRPYPAVPGLEALIARAQGEGWRLAVATNAMRPNAEASLSAIGLRDAFEVIVCGEELPPGKPDPGVFLEAMRQLGARPETSIAFEDSPSGVQAARASGAFTIGLRTALGHDALIAAGAQATIEDFTDPALPGHLERLKGAHP